MQLLEKTLIRVGNDEYARQNRSFGLTTLRDGHVEVRGHACDFTFRGKSGVEHEIDLDDRRLARIVRQCRDMPGYDLFQYLDENGERQTVGSADVNEYLNEITGQDYTSKDFRTWAGTVLAAQLLRDFEVVRRRDAQAKKNIVQAVEIGREAAGQHQGRVPQVLHPPRDLRSVHGRVDAETIAQRARRAARAVGSLTEGEAAVLGLLQRRLAERAKRRAS